jgi:hypothetical protein
LRGEPSNRSLESSGTPPPGLKPDPQDDAFLVGCANFAALLGTEPFGMCVGESPGPNQNPLRIKPCTSMHAGGFRR